MYWKIEPSGIIDKINKKGITIAKWNGLAVAKLNTI